jgi:hypothetical protein
MFRRVPFIVFLVLAYTSWDGLIHAQVPNPIDKPGTSGPALIAPGLISTQAGEYSPTYNQETRELYFMRRTPGKFDYTIMVTRQLADGSWTTSDTASFSGQYRDAAPYLSPDGQALYFDSRRPAPGIAQGSINLWSTKRGEDGVWQVPQLLRQASYNPPNESKAGRDEFGPAVDASGQLYFYSFHQPHRGGKRYRIAASDEGPLEIEERIPDPSAATFVSYLYISPDGKLAIMEGASSSGSNTDLFFSIRQPDGSWSPYKPLPLVNTRWGEGGPYLSPDGKLLFFTSDRPVGDAAAGNANLYWMEMESLSLQ